MDHRARLFHALVDTVLYAEDAEKQKLFFVTYRQHASPADLLRALQESFRASVQRDRPAAQKRVGSFLIGWIENCTEGTALTTILMKPSSVHFVAEKKVGEDLLSFAQEHLNPGTLNLIKLKFLHCSHNRIAKPTMDNVTTIRTPFDTTRPKEIAYYLTLIDWRHFAAVRACELFDMAWQKPNKSELSPNISMMTQRFNTISLWLADMLVVSYSSSTHTAVVEKVIDVVKELFKINNFNSAMALMTALNNASIMRLKQLWDGVKREQRDYFRRFEIFMSAKDNFKSYRKHLTQVAQSNKQKAQGSKTPLIPFLALFLRDLTFINDGNSDTKGHQLNIEKLELQGRHLLQMHEWQSVPYSLNFICDEAYVNFFANLAAPQEDEIFAKSIRLQPGVQDPFANMSPTKSMIRRYSVCEDDSSLIGDSQEIDVRYLRLNNTELSDALSEDLSEAESMYASGEDVTASLDMDPVADSSPLTGRSRSSSWAVMDTSPPSSLPSSRESSGSLSTDMIVSTSDATLNWGKNCPVLNWKVHDVADWLRRCAISEHIPLFMQAGVDGSRLVGMDHKLLSLLGVPSFKDRKVILLKLENLRQEIRGKTSSTGASGSTIEAEAMDQKSPSAAKLKKSNKSHSSGQIKRRSSSVESDSSGGWGTSKADLDQTRLKRSPGQRRSTISTEEAPDLSPLPASPLSVDLLGVGGASMMICCEDDKWHGGRLNAFSYDGLVKTILERYLGYFSSTEEVRIACGDKGAKIRNDKDLRKAKLRAKEKNELVVTFTVTKHPIHSS